MSTIYTCLRCGYSNKRKRNLKRHLLRKKSCKPTNINIPIKELLVLHKFINKEYTNQKIVIYEISDNIETHTEYVHKYTCKECKKTFSRRDNLKRHIDKWCKKIKEDEDTIEMSKNEWKQVLDQHKEELTEQITQSITTKLTKTLTKHISEQFENTALTQITNYNNNTQNNTIILNNYGNENKEYITENTLTYLVKRPGIAIRRLIEKMHFHPDHPENHNLKAANKRSDLVQVIEDNKWQYRDRKENNI